VGVKAFKAAYRAVYLASGLLFLAVALLGSAWWELVVGDPAKPALYVGLSPFGFEAELLGSRAVEVPPVLSALFLASRALAALGASTIIAGALLAGKPWSRKLFNLRPLTVPTGFAVLAFAAAALLPRYALSLAPQLAQLAPNLPEAFMPYSSGYLRLNLYPLVRASGYLDLAFRSQFTPSFWVALLSGALCLTGWILSKREARVTSKEANP
jgi:hypothetical protein